MPKRIVIICFGGLLIMGILSSVLLGFYLSQRKPVWYEIVRHPIQYGWSMWWKQGIASDGVHWYFSGKKCLGKAYINYSVIVENYYPIPFELVKEGYDHVGDVDFFDGLVFAPIEDRLYRNGTFVMYHAEKLTYTGVYKKTSQSHMPWCAVDSRTSRIYSSEFSDVDKLYVYDLKNDFKRLEDVRLNQTLQRVQGGAFYDGYLYLSCDDDGDHIFIVDIETGKVQGGFATNIGTEMEGITLYNFEDVGLGTMHFIDDGNYVYHYSFIFSSPIIEKSFRTHQAWLSPMRLCLDQRPKNLLARGVSK